MTMQPYRHRRGQVTPVVVMTGSVTTDLDVWAPAILARLCAPSALMAWTCAKALRDPLTVEATCVILAKADSGDPLANEISGDSETTGGVFCSGIEGDGFRVVADLPGARPQVRRTRSVPVAGRSNRDRGGFGFEGRSSYCAVGFPNAPIATTLCPRTPELCPYAPVAQLDRAPDYGSGGWGFESLRACAW